MMINNNFRSVFACSTLAIAAALSFSGQAQAEDVVITENIPVFCTFSGNSPGSFGLDTANNQLDTDETGFTSALGSLSGTAGSVDIDCNGASTLEITSVVATAAPTAATSLTATVSNDGGITTITSTGATSAAPLNIAGTGTETLTVDLEVNHGGVLTAGTYTYTVTLTANP